MSDRISEELFTKTVRDRGLAVLESIVGGFQRHPFYTIESGYGKELNFDRDFPAELQKGFAAYLGSKDAPVVIDAGGGEGQVALDLTKVIPKLHAIILDLYPPKREEHPDLYANKNISYIKADFDRGPLPIRGQSADLCVASRVSLYNDDPLKLINELIRVTKPGGYVTVDGADNLHVDRNSRVESDFEWLFPNVDPKGAVQFFYQQLSKDYLLIKVNDPSYQITGFELDQRQSTKEGKFFAATVGTGAVFTYKRPKKQS